MKSAKKKTPKGKKTVAVRDLKPKGGQTVKGGRTPDELGLDRR